MDSLYVRVDLAILPPKQFKFASLLLDSKANDQERNLTLKGLISLGYFCLNQKEISLFSSNTVKKLQNESHQFKFRIYESPELTLLSSISKKARRATINALLYTGVNSLLNLTSEYIHTDTSAEKKLKTEDLIYKSGLFNEFELVLGKAVNVESSYKHDLSAKQKAIQLDSADVLSQIPIPKLDNSVIKELVVKKVASETVEKTNPQIVTSDALKLDQVNENTEPTTVNSEEIVTQQNSGQVMQVIDQNITNASEQKDEIQPATIESTTKKNRWKKMSIDCG